jgi:phospholipid/cholesterol/gamma-HCH transport system permease protein
MVPGTGTDRATGTSFDVQSAAPQLRTVWLRMNPLASIGRVVLAFLAATGRLSLFAAEAVSNIVLPPIYWRLILQQILRIGYFSLPVVGLTAFFTGAVLCLQIYIGGNRFGAEQFVPQIVVIGITRELGPVIAGLMVAGRVSAAIAAEIGTMRVTEQIDALTTLSTNPFKYLVVPRLVAAVVSMPVLVAVADAIGVFGGYIVATRSLGFNWAVYLNNTMNFVTNQDVRSGLIKAAVFGFIIALMGCYHGFNSKGGAQGVGAATTNAVVSASILILAANYLMTSILFTN